MKKITQNEDGTVTIDGETYEITKKDDGVWTPRDRDRYYYVAAEGYIDLATWINEGDDMDVNISQQGNCFKTEEEADKYANFLKAKGTVSHYIRTTYPFKPDMSKGCQKACGIYHIQKEDEWVSLYTDWITDVIFPVMREKADAGEVIARFPEELEIVKQYLLTHN